MAKKTEDEPARDVQPDAAVFERPVDAGDDGFEGNAPVGVGLWIEEDLGVTHALRGGPLQVGPGQVVKIQLLKEYMAARVIDVEERLQVAEDVGTSNVFDRRIRQADAISPCQLEHQLRLERPLDMQMQLRLRESRGEAGDVHGRRLRHVNSRWQRSARPAARIVLTSSAVVMLPLASIAMPASLRMRSLAGTANSRR